MILEQNCIPSVSSRKCFFIEFLWGNSHKSNIQAIFGFLDLILKIKSRYAVDYLLSGKTMILSFTYKKMPPPLLFWSSLWGTKKPFIRNWVDGKVKSNLNINFSSYADDTIPFITGISFEQVILELENILLNISYWFKNNNLTKR